jgi:hypothetical protein
MAGRYGKKLLCKYPLEAKVCRYDRPWLQTFR